MTLAPIEHIPPRGGNEWIDLMKPAAELAVQIAETEFVPAEMRHRAEAIAACILFGAELGIGPMVALAKIDIIKGRPAPKAELGRALALGAGHDLWVDETTNTRVVVCGKRRNASHVFRVQWTMDDAKRAGIAGNPAYAKYPRQMLLARASAELVRQMCPEVFGGITLFSEEAVDIEPDDLPVIGPTLPAKAAVGPSKTTKTVPPVKACRTRQTGPRSRPHRRRPRRPTNPPKPKPRSPWPPSPKWTSPTATTGSRPRPASSAAPSNPGTTSPAPKHPPSSTPSRKLKAGTVGWQIDLDGNWHVTPVDNDELLT